MEDSLERIRKKTETLKEAMAELRAKRDLLLRQKKKAAKRLEELGYTPKTARKALGRLEKQNTAEQEALEGEIDEISRTLNSALEEIDAGTDL